jgi:hypothetical protein
MKGLSIGLFLALFLVLSPAWALFHHRGGSAVVSGGCAPGVVPPAPAAAWGLTCLAFDADFSLSTDPATGNQLVDTTNSLLPGFDFYINNGWTGQAGLQSNWQSMPPTTFGDYSLAGGAITMTNTSTTPANFIEFATCGYSSTSTPVGQTFLPPYYVDVTVTAISGSGTSFPSQWAAWWSMPSEFLTNSSGTINLTEIDNGEAPGGFGRSLHQWQDVGGTLTDIGSASLGANAETPNTYGILVIPPSLNSGNTLLAGFLSDVFDNSSVPSPGIQASAGQNFYEAGSQHACPFMNAGHGWSLSISKYRVWTLPPRSKSAGYPRLHPSRDRKVSLCSDRNVRAQCSTVRCRCIHF